MTKREPVYELQAKINFLMQAVIKEENLSAFSDKVSIARKTLDDGMKAGGLTGDNQTKLVQVCNFRLDWPEWNDPKAVRQTSHKERSDTAEKFEQRYRKENGMCLETDTDVQRQTGLRLRVDRSTQPWTVRDELAVLEIFPGQAGPEDPWPLSFDLECGWAQLDNVVVAVKRGMVELDLGKASTVRVRDRIEILQNCESNKKTVSISAGGPTQRPHWIMDISEKPLGVVSMPSGICPVSDLVPGDTVTATFSVWFKDLEAEACDEEDDAVPDDDAGENKYESFTRQGYKTLGKAKQKILEIIQNLELSGGQQERAVLASHILKFEKVDTENE